MAYKIVQIGLRGCALITLMLGMFFNWESYDLTTAPHFIMSGVFGGYAIITMGLLVEAGLDLESDKFIEASFLIGGIIVNLLCLTLCFLEMYSMATIVKGTINKGCMSILTVMVYLVDIILLFCK